MKHYDFQTKANSGNDFAEIYAPIFKLPLDKGISDNWLGDTQFSFEVFWQSSYHYHRSCRYSVSIHQNLKGVQLSQIDNGTSIVSKGVGYKIIEGEAIYFYVHAGVQNMPVRINVTGSSSANVFIEELPNESFGTVDGLNFAYVVNKDDMANAIFKYLEPVAQTPVYTSDVGGSNKIILEYTAPKNICGFIDITVKIYSNSTSGNSQIQINDTAPLVKENISLSSTSDTSKRYKFPISLTTGQKVTIYFAQWTGTDVNTEVKYSVSRGE